MRKSIIIIFILCGTVWAETSEEYRKQAEIYTDFSNVTSDLNEKSRLQKKAIELYTQSAIAYIQEQRDKQIKIDKAVKILKEE